MARAVYVVFLLPVVFSAIFGTVVMADILQKPDRELNMWNFGHKSIELVGLEHQYSTSQPINFNVVVYDPAFDCGDLYITILNDDLVMVQQGFFNQCFNQSNTLPINEEFSEVINVPGTYDVVVEINDINQEDSMVTSERLIVK